MRLTGPSDHARRLNGRYRRDITDLSPVSAVVGMADIARALTITESAARELVSALDALETMARPRGQRLSVSLTEIRRELSACTSRVSFRADTNAEAYVAQQDSESELMDTTTAAAVLNVSADAVRWLCRNGRLRATRYGGRWLIEAHSLTDYRARRD